MAALLRLACTSATAGGGGCLKLRQRQRRPLSACKPLRSGRLVRALPLTASLCSTGWQPRLAGSCEQIMWAGGLPLEKEGASGTSGWAVCGFGYGERFLQAPLHAGGVPDRPAIHVSMIKPTDCSMLPDRARSSSLHSPAHRSGRLLSLFPLRLRVVRLLSLPRLAGKECRRLPWAVSSSSLDNRPMLSGSWVSLFPASRWKTNK